MSTEIKRDIIKDLLQWKQRPDHKPLIICGAHQIGKTWTMRRFGVMTALRFSMNNLKRDGAILNIPIPLADWTAKILTL